MCIQHNDAPVLVLKYFIYVPFIVLSWYTYYLNSSSSNLKSLALYHAKNQLKVVYIPSRIAYSIEDSDDGLYCYATGSSTTYLISKLDSSSLSSAFEGMAFCF